MRVYYTPKQSVAKNDSLSPSAGKPALFVESVKSVVEVYGDFTALTKEQLSIAHDPTHVNDILSCRKPNGFDNTQKDIADSLLWTNASFYHAAKHALTSKVAMSPTSGFHHAGWDKCEGFCTFNGLCISALLLKNEGLVKNVGIIDFDAHYGNGTDDIIHKLGLSDWLTNYTFGAFATYDTNFDSWLTRLEAGALHMFAANNDILFYQAGADPHINDPYGGYLTTSQMIRRDRIVFETAKELGIPIVWNLAGGYQYPIEKVLTLHTNTLEECLKVYEG